MNKLKKLLFAAILAIVPVTFSATEHEIAFEDIPNNATIIGKHIFTEDYTITTKDVMLAAKTIEGTTKEDMIIIQKDLMGNYYDLAKPMIGGEYQEYVVADEEAKIAYEFIDYDDDAEIELEDFTVSFVTGVDGLEVEDEVVTKWETISAPAIERLGYTIKKWYVEGNENESFDFENTQIKEDLTLYAEWEKVKFTVSFDTDGGNEIEAQEVEYLDKVTAPENPIKAGYTFDKWTLDGEEYDFDTEVDEEFTLVATYTRDVIDAIDEVEEKAAYIQTHYYNQYDLLPEQDKRFITAENEEFNSEYYYIELGDYEGTAPEEISIGDSVYDDTEHTLSIGNNVHLKAPVWKIENDKLYVATTWLLAESLPNKDTVITAGEEEYTVTVFDSDVNGDAFSVVNALPLYSVSGALNTAEFNYNSETGVTTVTHTSSDGRQAVGIILNDGTVDILDEGLPIYALNQSGNMGFTLAGYDSSVNGGERDTLNTFSLYEKWKEGAFSLEDAQDPIIYKLAIPGKGTVSVTFVLVIPSYTVTFDAGEGAFANESSTDVREGLLYNATITPEEPSKANCTFTGWVEDGDELNTIVTTFKATKNVTYNASYDCE